MQRTNFIPYRLFPVFCIMLIAVFSLPGIKYAAMFQYDRAAVLNGDIWRIFTCHFVHQGFNHLILNVMAAILIFFIFDDFSSSVFGLWALFVCMLGVSLGHLVLYPFLSWYNGFSGVLHGLAVIGIFKEIQKGNTLYAVGLLLIGCKLLTECLTGPLPLSSSLLKTQIITSAHLIGSITGAGMMGVLFFIGIIFPGFGHPRTA